MSIVFTYFKHPKLPITIKIPVNLLQIVYICMTAISPNSSSWTTSLLTCLLRGCNSRGNVTGTRIHMIYIGLYRENIKIFLSEITRPRALKEMVTIKFVQIKAPGQNMVTWLTLANIGQRPKKSCLKLQGLEPWWFEHPLEVHYQVFLIVTL